MLEAAKCLYVPYIWGGNAPGDGMDCSGFVGHVLRTTGILPPTCDATAQMYSEMFKEYPLKTPQAASLAFYGRGGSNIVHVMLIVNQEACIGAVRGNKYIDTVARAKAKRARVDTRPINYRRDLRMILDPVKWSENDGRS